jgi:hypothetical protein
MSTSTSTSVRPPISIGGAVLFVDHQPWLALRRRPYRHVDTW